MGIMNIMGNLCQAQMAIKSASMMHGIQMGMNTEKQEINTEIKLDGHSTAAKDKRLDQIKNQTTKIDSYLSKSMEHANEQITKAQQGNQDSTNTDNQTQEEGVNSSEEANTAQPNSNSNSQDIDDKSSESKDDYTYTASGNTCICNENTNHKLDSVV